MKILYIVLTPLIVYALLIAIPAKYDCFLPKNYCLVGSEKLVDVLTISAYLIPILLVLDAYNTWKKQKGAEVIANEAKAFIIALSEIDEIQKTIHKSLIYTGGNMVAMSNITLYKETLLRLSNSLIIMKISIAEGDFTKSLDKVYQQAKLFLSDVEDYNNGSINTFNQIRFLNPVDSQLANESLLGYILFETKIVRKKKSSFKRK